MVGANNPKGTAMQIDTADITAALKEALGAFEDNLANALYDGLDHEEYESIAGTFRMCIEPENHTSSELLDPQEVHVGVDVDGDTHHFSFRLVSYRHGEGEASR